MAYLGLLPSEHSSGHTVTKGPITKCGNGHVRWILTEAAQHYFHPPKVSQELSRRHGRALLDRGKSKQKTVTAIARELAGFLWALYHEQQTPGRILARPRRQRQPAPTPAHPAPSARATGSRVRQYNLHQPNHARKSGRRSGHAKAEVAGSGGGKPSR